jgi:hypothetical protein
MKHVKYAFIFLLAAAAGSACNTTDALGFDDIHGIYKGKRVGYPGTFPVVIYQSNGAEFLIEADWTSSIASRSVRATLNNDMIVLQNFISINNQIKGTGKIHANTIEFSYQIDNSGTYKIVAAKE